jgi:hypothetical protein
VLWTQKQDIGPGARAFHAMAYDTTRQRSKPVPSRITTANPTREPVVALVMMAAIDPPSILADFVRWALARIGVPVDP